MKYCSHCKVDFSGDLDTCPLCQRPLTGSPSPAVFPHAAIVKPQKLMISFVFFGSGAAVFTMALLCGLGVIPPNIALLVSGVVVANGLFVRNLIVQNPGFVRGASRYLLLLIGLSLLCYLLTQADFFTSLVIRRRVCQVPHLRRHLRIHPSGAGASRLFPLASFGVYLRLLLGDTGALCLCVPAPGALWGHLQAVQRLVKTD